MQQWLVQSELKLSDTWPSVVVSCSQQCLPLYLILFAPLSHDVNNHWKVDGGGGGGGESNYFHVGCYLRDLLVGTIFCSYFWEVIAFRS